MVANEAWYAGESGVGAVGPARGNVSAVSWAAVLAGAAAAAALSLILLLLGVGLGLSVVSPWGGDGSNAGALGMASVVWLAFTQLAASGLGGYLAGRLRVRWRDTDVDEVHFRDTAHGLLSWAVATLFTAAALTASVGAIAGIGVKAPGVAATAANAVAAAANTTAGTAPSANGGAVAAPSALAAPSASAPALSQDAIDAARKTALWMFVSLLIGAFTASGLATIGGRQRDRFE
jgi:hypothetical protein